MGILPCPVAWASAEFLVDGEHQAHAPRGWAKAYRTGVLLLASRAQAKKACILTGQYLTGSIYLDDFLDSSIHEKGCLVGGRSPSFKHASHETSHFTPHTSADSVHLCSCVTADHGSRSRSGSHAPAQSVPSPRCGRSPGATCAGLPFTCGGLGQFRLRPRHGVVKPVGPRRCILYFEVCAPTAGRNHPPTHT
jgi:hypothetical protein